MTRFSIAFALGVAMIAAPAYAKNTVPFPVDRPSCGSTCAKTVQMYAAALKAWPALSQERAEQCADDQKGGPVHYPDLEQCVLDSGS